ncbi:egg cell-secreted protein 1.4-like [Phalaenopsis equestris]|uniref:egg cell-secreted protein 1.4-like n=1 Tax=Phalaenopsis equestris TaxID=78828 RepID=UPI0009E5AC4A|nr:egg cell-secreted protein 1.4-like [Phalaenopsis equestris]
MKATLELVLLVISLSLPAAFAQGPPPPKWKWPSPGVLPSPILRDPELRECWNPLRKPPGCMPSIYDSSEKGMVSLSTECCDAVKALSPRCFERIFTAQPFQPEFSQKVRDFCASVQGTSPASAPSF